VHVWTIDQPAVMEALLDAGVDGLMSDRPSRLRDVFDRRRLSLTGETPTPSLRVDPG
jgi:glycerophosphoryl diester phosphodiesterase